MDGSLPTGLTAGEALPSLDEAPESGRVEESLLPDPGGDAARVLDAALEVGSDAVPPVPPELEAGEAVFPAARLIKSLSSPPVDSEDVGLSEDDAGESEPGLIPGGAPPGEDGGVGASDTSLRRTMMLRAWPPETM